MLSAYLCVDDYLRIDITGKVKLQRSIQASLNMSELTINVTARDDSSCCQPLMPRLSSMTTIRVQIIGVNTQPTFPKCHSYRPSVLENAAVNTTVLQV